MGPRIGGEPTTVGSGTAGAVTYSPGVPGGAVTGGTWSKKPPFSSYVTNIAVFAQCTGFVLKAVIIEEREISPKSDGSRGGSEPTVEPITHEPCGIFAVSAPGLHS